MKINKRWDYLLKNEYQKDYFIKLESFIEAEYNNHSILPKQENIYNALKLVDYDEVKVVILGQDPYINKGQAHGIAFSVLNTVTFPPSLRNIFLELKTDLGLDYPKQGNLSKWAKQGVLLLNRILTVRENETNSHKGIGWETFTSKILSLLNDKKEPIVFILWGRNAQSKLKILNNPNHYIIQSPHPSPLSAHRGFFGSKPFSKTNKFLGSIGKEPIDWQI